jgi:hypothetical protein
MRKLAVDFDFTILAPLIVFLLIVLWRSVRLYRWPSEERLDRRTFEEGEENLKWEQKRREQKRSAKESIWLSSVALLATVGLVAMTDIWKVNIGSLVWKFLEFASMISFIISAGAAWHYAEKQDRLKLIACLLAMLVTAASAEHFIHQTINSSRIVCPHCSDEDQSDDE